MPELNSSQIIDLLNNGQPQQAESYLKDFLKSSLSPVEKGEALVSLASLHMELENSKNRQYLEFLDNAIQLVKNLQKEERAAEDKIDLDLARHQLGKDS